MTQLGSPCENSSRYTLRGKALFCVYVVFQENFFKMACNSSIDSSGSFGVLLKGVVNFETFSFSLLLLENASGLACAVGVGFFGVFFLSFLSLKETFMKHF